LKECFREVGRFNPNDPNRPTQNVVMQKTIGNEEQEETEKRRKEKPHRLKNGNKGYRNRIR